MLRDEGNRREPREMVGVGKRLDDRSPVCTAAYRMRPQITFPKKVVGADAERICKTCPMGVFDIEDMDGESTLKVARDLNCT